MSTHSRPVLPRQSGLALFARAVVLGLVIFAQPAQGRAQTAAMACLTEAIYFEAGSRGPTARAAVGHTVMNRVKSRKFPNSICEVVQEGEEDGDCQFSYRCDGKPETYQYHAQLESAQTAARRIIDGVTDDPTNGALFFHSERIPAGWFASLQRLGTFGGNIFYR